MAGLRWRWLILSAFLLSSSLNFLDRQLLAAYAPVIKREFGLNNTDYGWLLAAFSIAYGLSAPVLGALIDRWGLTIGTAFAAAAWSLTGAATSLVNTFPALLACRSALGVSEAAGIPASGKAYAKYLPSSERALGTAMGQVGITLGSMAAPLLASRLEWRQAFLVAGLIGLLWVVMWLFIGGREPKSNTTPARFAVILRDRRVWSLCIANVFAMVTYSLWTNWTTIYLVREFGLALAVANARFAWLPPVWATLGGFAGGWLSWRWARHWPSLQKVRWSVCALAALLMLPTALIPFAPNALAGTIGICLSFFLTLAISVNVYAMPLDLFGEGRAAFATSLLTAVYGLMQWPLSPAVGWMVDHYGFRPVCFGAALMPLTAVLILRAARLHE